MPAAHAEAFAQRARHGQAHVLRYPVPAPAAGPEAAAKGGDDGRVTGYPRLAALDVPAPICGEWPHRPEERE